MKVVEVKSKQEKKDFIDFSKKLYKEDPFWVCPLDSGIESVFEPLKNHTFKNGEATRWILKDNDNNTIGKNNEKDFIEDQSGSDLDVPGSELDDEQEKIGSEDEENNYYSLGGDGHNDLDEDKGD